ASRAVLKGEQPLRLRRQVDRPLPKRRASRAADGARVAASVTENLAVFEALRTWRLEVARRHAVPAYTVFHDSTLHEIASVLPRSLDELRSVSGIGATKL